MGCLWIVFIIFYYVQLVHSLLCYNGTVTYKQFGEDPLQRRSLLWRNNKALYRFRCSLTILCSVSKYEHEKLPGNHLEMICLKYLLLIICITKTRALMCFNCSTTHREKAPCAGDFVDPPLYFNGSRRFLNNCTGEKAMCFVRSWSARAKHAWIIQRGCYTLTKEDSLLQDLTVPTRAMTCKHQRFADAEYKVCLCQADWCNGASSRIVYMSLTKNRMWAWVYVLAVSTLIRNYVYVFYECTCDSPLEILRHS